MGEGVGARCVAADPEGNKMTIPGADLKLVIKEEGPRRQLCQFCFYPPQRSSPSIMRSVSATELGLMLKSCLRGDTVYIARLGLI